MSDQLEQIQTEDWLLFLSTALGAVGMTATNNPMYYLYGLTLGATAKSLLSLGPNWKSWEDWALFGGAVAGSLGSSLSSNPNYMLAGLILGAIGKATPSLVKNPRNLEDWFLLIGPLSTGLASAFSGQPKFAMVGLFFGTVGKALASVNPDSTSGESQPPQTPAPPAQASATTPSQTSGLAGNRNYILWNNCIPLVNPSVTFAAATDVHASGNWDLQVNAYAPSGADAYMQFVIAVTTGGDVQWSIENWPISGSNLFNTGDQPLYKLPSDFLPKGYSVSVKMDTDPMTTNVTALEFSVSNAAGAQLATKKVLLDSTLPMSNGSWSDSYLSQVVGFEPNMVGYNGGVAVTFSSGTAGSLTCTADTISASSSIPSCAEAKAGTVENSNLQYSLGAGGSGAAVVIEVSAP